MVQFELVLLQFELVLEVWVQLQPKIQSLLLEVRMLLKIQSRLEEVSIMSIRHHQSKAVAHVR